ncbi:MAG: FecR domain-containing protein [Candidatus Omnitrophica bacterium]|nr:FecR domain-containing protein [Candidatus Omnitrophota bacterium]
MNNKVLENFDLIMANLKPIEASPGFDFEFRRRFEAAVRERCAETAFERIARRAVETFNSAFAPKIPVLIRSAAMFLILAVIGSGIYFAQPAKPLMLAKAQYLHIGSIVSTGNLSRLDIVLSGKYAIRLKKNTTLRVANLTPRRGRGKAVFELIEGTMLVSVEKGFKGSEFFVDTKEGSARALGTKFAVSASREEKITDVSVLEGKVEVEGGKELVLVKAGQKTEIPLGKSPLVPQRLVESEWLALEELYQIGKKPQVVLLVKNTPDRVRQLLAPCPIYITDEKPREIPKTLEEALVKIEEAIKTGDNQKHLEAIGLLERIASERPEASYATPLTLYIGAYYSYAGEPKKAIETFKGFLAEYPDSPLASIAQAAIGVIYEEDLNDEAKAKEAYSSVLNKYPNSLEAIWVEDRLKIKKLAKLPKYLAPGRVYKSEDDEHEAVYRKMLFAGRENKNFC